MSPARALWPALFVLGAMLAGCADGGGDRPMSARTGVTFTPDRNGLAVDGRSQRIDFGRAPSGVITALDRELGRGRDVSLIGCPAAIASQRDWAGLILTFTAERFVGWRTAADRAGQTCG
ncbi:hypothetical protein [Sinisalibacter aestuarii]|uniref:Uncharacterized protein n=1 Tax=Sinisalibacter aestuarii TaxID=2949426 RepID=A0ABQ5LNA0_9RHOB|nr:hypothetical protein [Sinisalibacter aestuarii]GKY86489.1 hypothetical protein STA1M1_03580 [Sinisalibacter aestuarii]